jgi:hypothetical protein
MSTVNAGFLTLLRRRIDWLKDSRLPSRRQEELLRRAEESLYRPPKDSSSDAIDLLNRQLRQELGIKE